MHIGLPLDPRPEVFSQNKFIILPFLDEKTSKHQTCLYFCLSSTCTVKYNYFSKIFFFMYVIENHISLFCYSVIIQHHFSQVFLISDFYVWRFFFSFIPVSQYFISCSVVIQVTLFWIQKYTHNKYFNIILYLENLQSTLSEGLVNILNCPTVQETMAIISNVAPLN